MNEEAILAIIKYIDECLFEPANNWPKNWFNQRTYSRWAANEILELVIDNPLTQPSMVIDEFLVKMSYYSCMSENQNINIIFSTAVDTAEDILCLVW